MPHEHEQPPQGWLITRNGEVDVVKGACGCG